MDAARLPFPPEPRLTQLLMAAPRGVRPAGVVAGRISGEEFSLEVVKGSRGARNLGGSLGNQMLEGRVEETNGVRHCTGVGLSGSYDVTSEPVEGGRQAEGWVGSRSLELSSRNWGATVKIEGRIGHDRVVLTQWNQRDGHMLSGYIGNRNISLQSRVAPGETPLEPLDYLPLLVKPEPEYPVRTYAFSSSCGIDALA